MQEGPQSIKLDLADSRPRTEGKKFDTGKLRASLIPKGVMRSVIAVLEFGAAKYGEENWRDVPHGHQRYYDAMQRHIAAWWEGEKYDPETKQHHLAHAICCALFLIAKD